MASNGSSDPRDEAALLDAARPTTDDAVAEVLRAKVRRGLLGDAAAPPKIGRFTVLGFHGEGAFGTVYAAYDPVLDRRVALKVFSRDVDADAALVEARALAKLQHRHVVTIHDAAQVDGQTFVAMEFVEGGNLRQWLQRRAPAPEEIVATLRAAAEGLAAAHAEQIAHGDFKPDNVLIADDGPRVADFSLARRIAGDDDEPGGGSPAYMAPERLDGGPPSAAADQYAFGVTLYEALTGARPYTGDTVAALREAIAAGPPSIPTGGPEAALAVAGRACAADPTQRFGSMDAVVAALTPKPRRSALRWVGLLAATATVAVFVGWAARGDDPCEGGEALIAADYGPPQRDRVAAALAAQLDPISPGLSARTIGRLDAYRDTWTEAHRDACEATRVHGTQSDSRYDARMRCLEAARVRFGALVDGLQTIDERAAAAADDAVSRLNDPAACDSDRALAGRFSRPDDPEVAPLRARLAEAAAHFALSRYADAERVAAEVDEAARDHDDPSLRAEAALQLGLAHSRIRAPHDAEGTLRRAHATAAAAGLDDLTADASLALLRTVMLTSPLDRVQDLAPFALSDARRAGRSIAPIDGIVGEAFVHADRPADALEPIGHALEGTTRPEARALLLSTRASAKLAMSDPEGALGDYAAAHALARDHYGEGHPRLSFFLHRVGRGQLAAGDATAALATLRRALDARVATLGPDDRAVASVLFDLAQAQGASGDVDGARSSLQRALKIRRTVFGSDHPRTVEVARQLDDVASPGDQVR